MPIVLKDIFQAAEARSLDIIVAANPRGPPGKFYREEIARTLIDTLQSGGSSARVEAAEHVDSKQREHWERFHTRLEAGELVSNVMTSVFVFLSDLVV